MKHYALALTLLLCPWLTAGAEFSLTDTHGQTHTLASHHNKWVLVNLWATWCAPCIAEMPQLEALSKSHSNLVVLGLAIDGQDARRLMQFADKLNITYPVIAGNAQLAQQFKPKGVPTSILYDGTGKQILIKEGPVTAAEIENYLDGKVTK